MAVKFINSFIIYRYNLDYPLLAIFPEYSKSGVLETHKSMVKKSQTPKL